MAEIKEQVTVPASTVERTVAHTCDLCGRRSEQQRVFEPNWLHPKMAVDGQFSTTTVKLEFGSHWPNGEGSADSREYHICTPCFTNKLEPWLHAQGAKPTTHRVDY